MKLNHNSIKYLKDTPNQAINYMNPLLFYALAIMWLQGAIASALPHGYTLGIQLLTTAGINDSLITLFINGGIAADITMGLAAIWVAIYPRLRGQYALMGAFLITVYTILATVLAPQLWLNDPFGALVKNLPLIVIHIYLFNIYTKK
jgi:hypothetical protein